MVSVVWLCVLAYVGAMIALLAWLIRTQPAAPENGPSSSGAGKGDGGESVARAEPVSQEAETERYEKLGPWY